MHFYRNLVIITLRRLSSSQRNPIEVNSVQTEISTKNQFDRLADRVTPLWKYDYEEQLNIKKESCHNIIKNFKSKNIPKQKVKIRQIIPSPEIVHYRNKDDFSVRTGVDGNTKTVGHFIGSPAHDQVICVPPTHLVNTRQKHVSVAQAYQDFLRSSELPACHDLNDGGYWRNIVVRSNKNGDTMAVVKAHPKGASQEEIDISKKELANYFLSNDCQLQSLHFQLCPHVNCSEESHPSCILFGERYLEETVGNYKFRISADSFFQINTSVLPIMYESALELCSPSSRTTLIDLCCGIGTMSIFSNNSVRGCIGIEQNLSAVNDAEFNCKNNGITNCSFTRGRVEECLIDILKELDHSSDIVAVVNPGRAGVGRDVIRSLRRCDRLNQLVYISCKPDHRSSLNNFVDLCNPKFDKSVPFYLTHVQPLDMFPQTIHYEMLMLFQR